MVMKTQALEVARNGPPSASRIGRIEFGDVVELAPARGHRTTREPAVTVDGPYKRGQSRSRSVGQRAGRWIGLGAMPIRSSNYVRGSRDQPLHRSNPISAAFRFATQAIASGDKRQDSRRYAAGAVDSRRPESESRQTVPAKWNRRQAREQSRDRLARTRRYSRDLTSTRGASADRTRCAATASDARAQLIDLLGILPRTFRCHTGKSARSHRAGEQPARRPGASRHFVDRGCRRFRRPR